MPRAGGGKGFRIGRPSAKIAYEGRWSVREGCDLKQRMTGTVVLVAWIAGVVCCTAGGLAAAPITDLDEAAATSPTSDAGAVIGRPARTVNPGGRLSDRTPVPDASTGNKNLDLLLDLQIKPGEPGRQAVPRSTTATAPGSVAVETLPPQAVERPVVDPGTARPRPQGFDGMGRLDSDGEGLARPTEQTTERREWTGRPAGAGGGSDHGDSGGGRRSDADRAAYADDNLLRALPREWIALLREHRYWFLGALAVVALMGAAIKSYSRRI